MSPEEHCYFDIFSQSLLKKCDLKGWDDEPSNWDDEPSNWDDEPSNWDQLESETPGIFVWRKKVILPHGS